MVNYPTEFLSYLVPPGQLHRRIEQKSGTPVMLLRSFVLSMLYNGTRLVVKKMTTHVIEVTFSQNVEKENMFAYPDFLSFYWEQKFLFRLEECNSLFVSPLQSLSINPRVKHCLLEELCISHTCD